EQLALGQLLGVETRFPAPTVAQRDHEDLLAPLVEASRLEVELQAVEVLVAQALEVGPPAPGQVLFDRRPPEHQLPHRAEAAGRFAGQALVGRDQGRLESIESL